MALLVLMSSRVEAQRAVIDARAAGDSEPSEAWRTALETALTNSGRAVANSDGEGRATEPPSVPHPRVRVFAEVEEHLVEARQLAVTLQEGPALARLSLARQIVENHADVPGATAWLAEVETAIGIVAAQAGLNALSEQSIVRAVTLDPGRGVRDGEAPPGVVARAQRVARAALTAPTGVFRVRCAAPGAVVFLDGERLGPAPRVIRATSGRHVLRVQAPGHRAYGRAFELSEGVRPMVEVVLAPERSVVYAERLRTAMERLDADTIRTLLPRAGFDEAWAIWTGNRTERALLTRCEATGCREPQRVTSFDAIDVSSGRASVSSAVLEVAVRRGSVWLNAPREDAPGDDTPFFAKGWFWGVVGAVLGAAAITVTAVLLTRPDAEELPQIVIDPMLSE